MALPTQALNVITAVKYEADTINAFNRMTFLYDPNWQGMGNTLPISFFYVKDFKEVMETEISQKPLLFYNSQNGDNKDAVAGGLLGIVSDNLINKPKKYQMSIIIPRTVDVYLRQSMFNRRVTVDDLFRTNNDTFNQILQGVDVLSRVTIDTLTTLLKTLGLPSSAFQEFGTGALDLKGYISKVISSSVDDSNKASLEAMWENRTILRMKYWNGWKFKYVAIENYTPSKDGTEEGFYQATLNVTEVPIMTVRKQSKTGLLKTNTALGSIVAERKAKILAFLDKMEATGV